MGEVRWPSRKNTKLFLTRSKKGDIDDVEFRRLLAEVHLYLDEFGIQDNQPPPEPNRPKTTKYERLVMAWDDASHDDREKFLAKRLTGGPT